MKTTINLRTLKAVALAAGAERARDYLMGVLAECRETSITYVATNGHIMFVAQEELQPREDGEQRLLGDFIIPTAAIKVQKVGKISRGLDNSVLVRDGAEAGTLRLADTIFTPIDGAFCDWRRVLPGVPKAANPPAQFASVYLAMLQAFAGAIGASPECVHIHHTKADHAHAITFGTDHPTKFGVLMPVRGAAASPWHGAPAWASACGS